MTKKQIAFKIISYLLFIGFSLFILVQISLKQLETRKGKYQEKYITPLYNKNDINDDKRYILENASLHGGMVNLKPIKSIDVPVDKFNDKEFKLSVKLDVYKFAIKNKKEKDGYDQGFIIYFKSLKLFKKVGATYEETDLTFRSKESIKGILDNKDFFSNEDLKKKYLQNMLRINFEFDPVPDLLKNTDPKLDKKNVACDVLKPFYPYLFTNLSLKSGKTVSSISAIKISYIDPSDATKIHEEKIKIQEAKTVTPLLNIVKENYEGSSALFDHKEAELFGKYTSEKTELDAVNILKYDNSKYITDEEINSTYDNKFVRRDIKKNLNEFNKIPLLVIFGVIALILIAAYFLFGHRYVVAAVKKRKEAKKEKIEKIKNENNFQDAEFVDVTETEATSSEDSTEKIVEEESKE